MRFSYGMFIVLALFGFGIILMENANLPSIQPRSQLAAVSGAGSGLVGWWKFDEAGGVEVADSSDSAGNATFSTGVSWGTDSTRSSHVTLDGSNPITLSKPNLYPLAGPFTVSAWVKLPSPETQGAGIISWGNTESYAGMYYNGGVRCGAAGNPTGDSGGGVTVANLT